MEHHKVNHNGDQHIIQLPISEHFHETFSQSLHRLGRKLFSCHSHAPPSILFTTASLRYPDGKIRYFLYAFVSFLFILRYLIIQCNMLFLTFYKHFCLLYAIFFCYFQIRCVFAHPG